MNKHIVARWGPVGVRHCRSGVYLVRFQPSFSLIELIFCAEMSVDIIPISIVDNVNTQESSKTHCYSWFMMMMIIIFILNYYDDCNCDLYCDGTFCWRRRNPWNIKPTVFGPEDCPKNTRPSIALQYRKERRYQFNVLLIYDGLCANKLSI